MCCVWTTLFDCVPSTSAEECGENPVSTRVFYGRDDHLVAPRNDRGPRPKLARCMWGSTFVDWPWPREGRAVTVDAIRLCFLES